MFSSPKDRVGILTVGIMVLLLVKLLCVAAVWSCAPQDNGAAPKVPRFNSPQTRVLNPGFELGSAYWKTLSDGLLGAQLQADSLEAFAGKRALRLDLQNMKKLESNGAFYLVTPWLSLAAGGSFSFTVHGKSNQPNAKIVLLVFNAASKEGLTSGEQEQKPVAKEFPLPKDWTKCVSEGQLPVAEKDNYRFAIKFTEPATYWLDQVEILHNGEPGTVTPEVEAAFYPPASDKILSAADGRSPARLEVVNHTEKQRRLRLVARQSAMLHSFEPTVEREITLAPNQHHAESVKFETPHADVYQVKWELLDERSRPLQSGKMRLAVFSADLPRPNPDAEPVWGMHLNSMNLEYNLPILRQAGIRHLRNVVNFHWNLIEPQRNNWQWPEALLTYLEAQGFVALGKLGFTPKWAIAPDQAKGWPINNKMPQAMNDFRNYLHSVISNYGSRIQRWEFWNEPNLTRYFDGTPAEYASLLAIASAEIKAAQPQAEVAGFSVAKFYRPETMDFFRQALASQPTLRLDAVSFHPYFSNAPEKAGIGNRIDSVQALFQQSASEPLAMWITEYGYQGTEALNTRIAYHPEPRANMGDEMTQAAYLVRTACLARAEGTKYFFCYSMDSDRLNRSSDLFGVREESWMAGPKPALLAYTTLAQLLGDAVYEKREKLNQPDTYLMHFRRSDRRQVSVLWQAAGKPQFTLPAQLDGAEAFDFFGNRKTFRRQEAITLDGRPLYFLK